MVSRLLPWPRAASRSMTARPSARGGGEWPSRLPRRASYYTAARHSLGEWEDNGAEAAAAAAVRAGGAAAAPCRTSRASARSEAGPIN